LSGRLVYAMKVDEGIPLSEYDRRAPLEWPCKVPNPISFDLADRLGDCIYDYSVPGHPPFQRAGVHGPQNIPVDLGGMNVLLSRDFYYFGSAAIPLPSNLIAICHQGVGHKSKANAHSVAPFQSWIRGLNLSIGQLHGWPDTIVNWTAANSGCGCNERTLSKVNDPVC
jgi:hypothetical protein